MHQLLFYPILYYEYLLFTQHHINATRCYCFRGATDNDTRTQDNMNIAEDDGEGATWRHSAHDHSETDTIPQSPAEEHSLMKDTKTLTSISDDATKVVGAGPVEKKGRVIRRRQ